MGYIFYEKDYYFPLLLIWKGVPSIFYPLVCKCVETTDPGNPTQSQSFHQTKHINNNSDRFSRRNNKILVTGFTYTLKFGEQMKKELIFQKKSSICC